MMQEKKAPQERKTADALAKMNLAGKSMSDENQNQHHNAKKVSLGPNTKR